MTDINSTLADYPLGHSLVLADGSAVLVNEVVRIVPNKRLVCKAVWHQQNVFAKLFVGANPKRYAQRDKKGVQALIDGNISTPDLLHVGSFDEYEVLIFKAIDSAQNAETLYQHLNDLQQTAARLTLMLQLTTIVAQLHNANLQQTDLYFKNFLIDSEKTYAIDGDGIRAFSSLFNKQAKQHNLATLFSKMDALDDVWIPECYEHYCKQSATKFATQHLAHIQNLTQKYRQKVASAFADKKVFRTCTDVKVNQNFKQYFALANGFDAVHLSVKQLDEALLNPQNQLKNGNTCTVGKAVIASQNVAIKRYNIKNIWHAFKLSISQSRAAKSWANAHRLQLLNIATAKPLALIEERFGCLKRRAYFLTEYIDAPDIAEFFALSLDAEAKQKVAYETALLFYKLNMLQISHGDCKASNIKIVDNKPVLIDLDSMQAHTSIWWFETKHIKDLKRFMQNWANSPETAAIFKQAFVQAYDEVDDYMLPTILERAKIA